MILLKLNSLILSLLFVSGIAKLMKEARANKKKKDTAICIFMSIFALINFLYIFSITFKLR